MNASKSSATVSALALMAIAVQPAHAGPSSLYSAPFQGLTFAFTDANGDWATTNLDTFNLKDLVLDFKTLTGTANQPGSVDLPGTSQDCSQISWQSGTICFDINFSSPLQLLFAGPTGSNVWAFYSLTSSSSISEVSEPGTDALALLGLGLLGASFIARRTGRR